MWLIPCGGASAQLEWTGRQRNMADRRGQSSETAPPAGEPTAAQEWISVADAAEQLGINRRTLTRAAQVGNLEARRIRQVWVTTLPAAQAWLKAARHRPG